MISGILCISEKFRLASSSCPNPSLPNVSVLFFNVPFFPDISVIHISFPFHFRNIPSFIFHPFRVIVHLRMIRLVSISLPSPSLPDVRSFLFCLFPYFRKFPSCISHHFRFNSGLFRRHIFGSFRPSYFIISASFPVFTVVIFPEISVLHIPSFPFISGLFRCHISGNFAFHISSFPLHFRIIVSSYFRNFRPSYFIISASFPDYSVVLFPEISVIHISSFPLHFRMIPLSCFRKFPSFIFHHFRFISGLFRFGRPCHF